MNVLTLGMENPKKRVGGLDAYRVGLETALAARGHDVRSVVLAGGRLPSDRFRRTRRVGLEAVHNLPPDLVACHFAYTGLAFSMSPLKKIPWVIHFHGPWARESSAEGERLLSVLVKRSVERSVYRRARRVLVLSKAFGDIAASDYGIPESRIFVVPAAVDTDRFGLGSRKEARETLGLPQDRFVVLTVRRLARRMGLERILDAVSEERSRDRLWLIGGRGLLHGELSDAIRKRDLSRRVVLLGSIPDTILPLYYQAADVFVLPSASLEGFGLVLLESLASGTPVLATAVGGVPEILSSYAPDALLSSGANGGELLERVDALESGRLRLPVGKDARKWVLDRYTWELAAAAVEGHYRKVVENGG